MAGSKSDYLEAQVLNFVLGSATWTKPTSILVALSTSAYSDSATSGSMTEVSASGTAYARVTLTNNATNWPNATGTNPTTKANGTAITFPTATAGWGTVNSFYLLDNSANVLYGGDLVTPRTVATGDTATFAIGALVVTEA